MVPINITPGSNHAGVTRFGGFSMYEDAGAPALVIFRKAVVGGQILFTVALTANQSVSFLFPQALSSEGGVYVQESSGSVTGVLYDAD